MTEQAGEKRSRGGDLGQRKRFKEGVKEASEVTKGVLITGPRKAIREVQQMLKSFVEIDDAAVKLDEKLETDLDAIIKAEAAEENNTFKEVSKRFKNVEVSGLGHLSFLLQFTDANDMPSKLVTEMMEAAIEEAILFKKDRIQDTSTPFIKSKIKCKFATRICPLDKVVAPNEEALKVALREIIARVMPESKAKKDMVANDVTSTNGSTAPSFCDSYTPLSPGDTYSIVYLRRSEYKGFKKSRVIQIADDIIGCDTYRVDLKNPKVAILVETNPSFFGVSVLSNWNKYRNLNVQALRFPEQPKQNAAAPDVADTVAITIEANSDGIASTNGTGRVEGSV